MQPIARVIQVVALQMEEDGEVVTYLYTVEGQLIAKLLNSEDSQVELPAGEEITA